MVDWTPAVQLAGTAASAGGNSATEALANWRNESLSCKAIRKLFVHTVVDKQNGGIKQDFYTSKKSGISFVTTKLMLDGLVEPRIYSIEVSNLTLELHDPGRVR